MGGYIDPETGNLRGHSSDNWNATPAQREAAIYGDCIAEDLLKAHDSGIRAFSCFKLKMKHSDLEPLVACHVLTKHKSDRHDGYYYRTTAITRRWCLVSLALRDQRRKQLAERTEGR